jgi:Ca-activated chloride channel family protein
VAALLVVVAGTGADLVRGHGTSGPPTVRVLKGGILTSIPEQTVVLLVDVSGSMAATDVAPSRLDAAVAGMRALVAQLPSRISVGLVSFSSSAKVVQTPTSNRKLVLSGLAGLSPVAGTALGDGLAKAVDLTVASLRRQGIQRAPGHFLPATIVLESDGAQNRGAVLPRQAAERAKAAGLRVDGIALGTPDGTVHFGFGAFQNRIPVPPDPGEVLMISKLTDGEAFSATTKARMTAIYRKLGAAIAG